MMMTEEQRTTLHNKLTDTIGQEAATTLMEQLPPMGWDRVATKDDIKASETTLRREIDASEKRVLGELRDAVKSLQGQIDRNNSRIDETNRLIADSESKLGARIDALTSRIDTLTTMVSEVHVTLARHMRWTVAAMFGVASLAMSLIAIF